MVVAAKDEFCGADRSAARTGCARRRARASSGLSRRVHVAERPAGARRVSRPRRHAGPPRRGAVARAGARHARRRSRRANGGSSAARRQLDDVRSRPAARRHPHAAGRRRRPAGRRRRPAAASRRCAAARARRPARHAQPARGARPRLRRLLERRPDPGPARRGRRRAGRRVRVTLAKGELDCEVRSTRPSRHEEPRHAKHWNRLVSIATSCALSAAHARHLDQGLRSRHRRARSDRQEARGRRPPLEQSLALYERGVQLSRFCHARLEEAERRIEILERARRAQAGAGRR